MSGFFSVLFLFSKWFKCLDYELQLLDEALLLSVDEETMPGHAVT